MCIFTCQVTTFSNKTLDVGFVSFIGLPNGRTRKCVLLKNQSPPQV